MTSRRRQRRLSGRREPDTPEPVADQAQPAGAQPEEPAAPDPGAPSRVAQQPRPPGGPNGESAEAPWEVVPATQRRPLPGYDGSRAIVGGLRHAPPRRTFVGPLEAVVRHPFITLLPILLLIGGAFAIGYDRKPTYTATSRLGVSLVDVQSQYLQQEVLGNQLLAVDYARAIYTPDVIRAVSRSARVSPREAEKRLTASPIIGSTIIRVDAKTQSRATAIALANAGGKALTDYIGKVTLSTDDARRLNKYRKAALKASQLQARIFRLQRARASSSRIAKATAAYQAALVDQSSLANLYTVQQENTPPRNRARVLTVAQTASSDFSSVLQRLVLIGAVAGAVLGVALALARANWRSWRD